MIKRRFRLLLVCIAILIFAFSLPCFVSASVFDVRQNFPAHIQGTYGIYLQYRNGANYVDLINNNPFGGGGLSNDYVFVNPDLTDLDHFPTILAYEYNNPVPSLNQISAAPSCIPRSNINADAVIRINLSDNGGQVQIKGSCGRSSSDDVYFTIYKGAGNYSSPVWSTWNSGIIDVTIPYSKGEQLFFATNSGTSCTDGNLAYWKDLKLITTPVAAFSGTPTTGPAPLSVTFTDQSTGSPTGWAWFFGDDKFTEPWTLVNGSAGWEAREHHSSVVMPDGSIVLMGGYVNGGKNDTWRSTDNGATWTLVNASSGWSERYGHSSVVMPDGSIVLMGGCYGDGNCRNDSWRSTDSGATWMLMNVSSGWSGRCIHSSVAMPDGSIVLMGGFTDDPFLINDVWRSRDYGATWTLVNASPGWSERRGHSSVVMPDGSIVLMGGDSPYGGLSVKNDTWKSMDNGATWTQMTANAEWSGRVYHSSVVMPDGSIMLMGGWSYDDLSLKNDMWRSTDNGHRWLQVNASAGWSERRGHSSVVMPDGSIVLIGGKDSIFSDDYKNDVWRFSPVGSSAQNPSHTYALPGIYNVSLQAYNDDGYTSTRKVGYITVVLPAKVGVYRPSVHTFYLKNGTALSWTTTAINWGISTDLPVTGDWNGDGITEVGVYRPSAHTFYLRSIFSNDYQIIVFNEIVNWGISTDLPVTGDWNGDGITDVGVFRPSTHMFYLRNGTTSWTTTAINWGISTDLPVTGDWNGDGITEVGVYRPSAHTFYLRNGTTSWTTTAINWGISTDLPVTGDWNGDGITDIGVFRPSTHMFYLKNGTALSWTTMAINWGISTDLPVTGKW